MKFLYYINSKLQNFGAYISSLLFLALVVLIVTEIILRSFFNISTMIADEYSGYFYLASIFFGLGYTFKENGHIRITILTSKLPQNIKRYIDIFAGTITLILMLFIFYRTILMVKESYDFEMVSETVSETPIYLTQIALPIGLFMFCFAIFVFIVKKVKSDS